MPETYTEWRLEDHITSGERARGVLEAAVEEDPGDGSLIRDVLSAIARFSEHECAGPRRRPEPGRPVQGAVRGRQSVVHNRHEDYPRPGTQATSRTRREALAGPRCGGTPQQGQAQLCCSISRRTRAGKSPRMASRERISRERSSMGRSTFTPPRRCDSRMAMAISSASRPSLPEQRGG